jgi:hypothetical protein
VNLHNLEASRPEHRVATLLARAKRLIALLNPWGCRFFVARKSRSFMNHDGCMWAVNGRFFFVIRDWSGRHNEGCLLSLFDCTCTVRGRSLPSAASAISLSGGYNPVRRGCRFRMVAEIRLQETFWYCPRVRVLQCWLGECPIRCALALRAPGRRPAIRLAMPCLVPGRKSARSKFFTGQECVPPSRM